MKTFDFTIYIDTEDLNEDDVNRLYEAGCGDATIGRIRGKCQAAFNRDAESLEVAIQSAIDDIQNAGFRIELIETQESATVQSFNRQITIAS